MMKRLVFCFDGTWNHLDAPNVTNVVHTASFIAPFDRSLEKSIEPIPQIVYYDEGVGTRKGERITGGIFGHGLMENIAEAYKFLVFNYQPGDEIYLFGFSRGAYTARSFAGMILFNGIVERDKINRVPEAIKMYKKRAEDINFNDDRHKLFRLDCSPYICVDNEELKWRLTYKPTASDEPKLLQKLSDFRKNLEDGKISILRIKYIGVWDTVGSLGVPRSWSIASFINRRYEFHDCNLSAFVTSARHAVAIDERRRSFEPTSWENMDCMNCKLGYRIDEKDLPYQQIWFPGVHGSVGGGGEISGLSLNALEWIIIGAEKNGLKFDQGVKDLIKTQKNALAPLRNLKNEKLSLRSLAMKLLPSRPRSNFIPRGFRHLSESAMVRSHADAIEIYEEELRTKCSCNTPRCDHCNSAKNVIKALKAKRIESEFSPELLSVVRRFEYRPHKVFKQVSFEKIFSVFLTGERADKFPKRTTIIENSSSENNSSKNLNSKSQWFELYPNKVLKPVSHRAIVSIFSPREKTANGPEEQENIGNIIYGDKNCDEKTNKEDCVNFDIQKTQIEPVEKPVGILTTLVSKIKKTDQKTKKKDSVNASHSVHIVKNGETLGTITTSEFSKASIENLNQNELKINSTLYPGQALIVPKTAPI